MKKTLIIINIILAVCLAYIGGSLIYKKFMAPGPQINIWSDADQDQNSGTLTSSVKISNTMLPANPDELPLTLWGTIMGPINSYAVIEDHQTRSQALYKPGDKIQNAVIKKVLKDSVILNYNNQDYILKNDLLNTLKPQSTKENSDTKAQTIQIKQSAFQSLLTRHEDLKRQISIKPIQNKGKPDGLILYRILPESIFHNLGLRNGDIVKKLNGKPLISLNDAANIYTESKSGNIFTILLLRKEKPLELIYHIIPDNGSDKKRSENQ